MINVALRIAVMEDGQELPVTNAFDEDGDECDPEDAGPAWRARIVTACGSAST